MSDIEIKHTEWNLKHIFESDNDPQIAEKKVIWEKSVKEFIEKWKNRGDYLEDPLVLKDALDHFERLSNSYGLASDEYTGSSSDEVYYFWLKLQQDQNDPEIKARFNKVEEFSKKVENDLSFFTLNITKIPKDKQALFLEDTSLEPYKHFLKRLFENAKHTLSIEEEKIMNLKSTSAYTMWKQMTSGFLSKEEREVLTESGSKEKKNLQGMAGLLQSKNKEVRDSAAKEMNDILEKYSDVAEAELNAVLYNKKVNDEIRNYDRPDASRHVLDDIDPEIIDSLVESVSKRFDISKRWYAIKAKLLGLEKLEYHERVVEYGDVDKEYTYEESVQLIGEVFKKLDSEFFNFLKMFVEEGHIDVFPRKGKRGGAFCVYFLKSQPTYILLNHTNKLKDVETLAHELGHAINNEYMKEAQNALNFETPTSTAEVASTFMEDFVFQKLLEDANEEEKLSLLVQKTDGDVASILRQIACYKFEQDLHKEYREKGHLSKEDIGKIFQKNMSAYMGDAVEQSKGSENWWVHWPHIRNYFYVYSYSSGLLISKALQRKVKENPKFIENVKEFLRAGTSKTPKQIFLELGIDISQKSFWEEGLKELEDLLEETESLAKKLGKI